LALPSLGRTITDSHLDARGRMGPLATYGSRRERRLDQHGAGINAFLLQEGST
jgi:cyanophycinase-like exopeptidase